MRIVVISDTHGKSSRIDEVMARQNGYDMLLFLGDGLRDFFGKEHFGAICVRGNCDSFFAEGLGACVPAERMLDADGFKILMMHGHEWGVKASYERAAAHAVSMGADALLFGHTHKAMEKYYPAGSEFCGTASEKPLYIFNPGSLGCSREGKPTFGTIEIKNGQLLLSIGEL